MVDILHGFRVCMPLDGDDEDFTALRTAGFDDPSRKGATPGENAELARHGL